MVLIDTNILAYLLIDGEQTEAARRLRRSDPDWRSEAFIMAEFTNVLVRYTLGKRIMLALAHAGLGDKDKAIDDLERAYREWSDPHMPNIKFDPILDPLWGDPRFEALVTKLFGANGTPSHQHSPP